MLYRTALLVGMIALAPLRAALTPQQVMELPAEAVEKQLPSEAPSSYFLYAGRRFFEGQSSEGVFWFYVAQIRARFDVAANPKQDPGDRPALYGSLMSVYGESINLYAGGDVDNWIRQIERALQWDADHDNGHTSKKAHAAAWKKTRAGLEELKNEMSANRAGFAAKRAEQGIGRVGVYDGVYIEERKPAMPKAWPRLRPQTAVPDLAGTYRGGGAVILARLLVGGAKPAPGVPTVRIAASGPGQLEVTVLRAGAAPVRRSISVEEQDGAVVFSETQKDETQTDTTTVRLARNEAGDLVLERRVLRQGRKAKLATRYDAVYWDRATTVAAAP